MSDDGLYGDATQRHLQAATLADFDALYNTPGAVFAARMKGTDDPEQFGWKQIETILRSDGAITFRMIPAGACAAVERRLFEMNCEITWWDVFESPSHEVVAACDTVLAGPEPKLLPVNLPASDVRFFTLVQAFMASCHIAPFPVQVLSGEKKPAVLEVLTDPKDGAIVATAFAYCPYNRYSAHHRTAWGGLVAVREDHRGQGAGIWVNARMLRRCSYELGPERLQQFARRSNAASCRMIERCGLRLRPDVRSGIAQPVGAALFTR